jgi:arabinogalactan oligomer/maltooligosaccharide transport system permease protein
LYPNNDINNTSTLFAEISFLNYENLMSDETRPFLRWYANTVIIGVLTSIGSVFLSALAAYSFSRLRFRGRRGGLLSLILMQMFPSILGLVAIFSLMSDIGQVFPELGLNSQLGLVMVYMGGALGGGTYLMYGFFNTVPKEIDEAAKIDGASRFAVFRFIQLPKMRNVLMIAVLLRFMDSFMIYTEPFVLTGGGPGNATTFLSQYLTQKAVGQFDLGPAAAFSLIYFLIILLMSFVLYTWMQRVGTGDKS